MYYITVMNIKAIAERIGMDYDAVMEDYCGDVAIVKEKLLSFPSNTSLTLLEESIIAGDMEGAKKEAHKIRKSAEKIGLSEIAKAADRLEEASTDKARSDFDALKKLYDKACAEIGSAT